MKKDRRYCFAGITIDDMNPDNIALKNDFNHNLHAMFITIAPMLSREFDDVKVLKAMCSHKMSVKNGNVSFVDKKYSSGDACKITYKDFSREKVLEVLLKYVGELDGSYSFVLGDSDFIVFKSEKQEILEYVNDEYRTIFA